MNNSKPIILNQQGISLIQTIMALAMLSVISLQYMKMDETARKSLKHVEGNIELNMIGIRSQTLIGTKAVCNSNLAGKDLGSQLTNLVDEKGNDIVKVGEVYGTSSKVKLTNISIEGISLPQDPSISTPAPLSTSSFKVKLDFDKLGNGQVKSISKFVYVNGVIENNKVVECYTTDNAVINEAVANACRGTGATYDTFTNTCLISSIGEKPQCPKGQALTMIDFDSIQNLYTAHCSLVYDESLCPDSGYINGFQNGSPVCVRPLDGVKGLKANNLNLAEVFDLTSTATIPSTGGTVSFYVNPAGKIALTATPTSPPPACSSCTQWSAWFLQSKSWSCSYGCSTGSLKLGTRTTCKYFRYCVQKAPLLCSGSIANQVSSYYTYLASQGGGKWRYKNRGEASAGNCPSASVFGLN